MADVQSNIHVNIDTSDALASLKLLQRQISAFHTQMAKSGTAASAVAANQAQNLMNSINATGKFQASMRTVTTSTESFTNALEKNKLTSREYFRYTGAATKTFGRLFRSEFDTLNKVARERVKDLQTQYIKMGRGANGALQAIAVRPLTLDMKNLGTQTAIAAQRQQLLNQLLKQGSTNLLNFGKNTQWAGRQLMVGFTVPLVMLGTQAAKTFMQLEEQAIRFKRVYGEMFTTQEETDKMVKNIQLLAKEYTKYGVAVEKTMEMAANAAAMGKMGADLIAQVSEATRLAVLGGVEQEQALETTISVTNAFGVATEDLANKIDFLNAVENQTVVSIEDLTIAIPKAGPVVKQLGGDVEDLAFFLTAMKEGGINASEGANALKSGLASLINPSEKASKMLMGLGVNINAIVEGNAGDVRSTVIDFAAALDTLDPLNRARAIEQLFGKFQFSRLSTLFQNVTQEGTQASRVLKLAQSTTEELAILSERELARVEDSTTYKFKKAMEDLKVSLAPVGEQFLKALTPIVEFVGKVLEKFNGLGDGSKKFLTIMTVALGAIGPIALMTFGLLANGVANIIKLFATLRSGFNRVGSSTNVLGQQTDYLSQQQLEASAIAASLNQVHTRLQQTFTSETAAVNALALAYRNAVAAQVGFTGPVRGGGMKGQAQSKKYATGVTKVPGTGNKDTVPAMLTPGEAVIPAGAAQDPANKPIIARMVAGQKVQGFNTGTTKVTYDGKEYNAKTARSAQSVREFLDQLIQNPDKTITDPHTGKTFTREQLSHAINYRSQPGKDFSASQIRRSIKRENRSNRSAVIKRLTDAYNEKNAKSIIEEKETLQKALRDRGLPPLNENQAKDAFETKKAHLTKDVDEDGNKRWRVVNVAPDAGYINQYMNTIEGELGKNLLKLTDADLKKLEIDRDHLKSFVDGNHPKDAKQLDTFRKIAQYDIELDKNRKVKKANIYQAHLVDAGLEWRAKEGIGGYSQAGLKSFADLNPTDKAVLLERVAEADPKDRFSQSSQERLKKTAALAAQTETGKLAPTNFGRLVVPTTGFSFDVPGVGGLYDGPNGKVFVKPMMSELDALAEKRATDFAREVHGLDTPEQKISTMIDPSDPEGKRKIIVLESKYDARFDEKKMSKTFTRDQYFRQLVASAVRGDKDLKMGNLGGNALTDVGTAGVFDKATSITKDGIRQLSKNMPSMYEMAEKNLQGVAGAQAKNSPNWFANETQKKINQANYTADQYDADMKKEIKRIQANTEAFVQKIPLNDPLRPAYLDILRRVNEGAAVKDWRPLYDKHRSIAIKPNEVTVDKDGKAKKPKSERRKSGTKTKSPSDTRTIPKSQAPAVRNVTNIRGKADAATIINPALADRVEERKIKELANKKAMAEASARERYGKANPTAYEKSIRRKNDQNARRGVPLIGSTPTAPVSVINPALAERMAERKAEQAANKQAAAQANTRTMYGTEAPTASQRSIRRKNEKLQRQGKPLVGLTKELAAPVSVFRKVLDKTTDSLKKQTVASKALEKVRVSNQKKADAKAAKAAKTTGPAKQRVGLGGAAMAASGVAMVGSMIPGSVGETMQKIMMPLMGLSMILPMLGSVTGALTVALLAGIGAIVKLRMEFDKAQNEAIKLANTMGSGKDAMREYSKFAGTVTAGEIMERRSQEKFGLVGAKPGKTTFGESFVQSESGKGMLAATNSRLKTGDAKGATADLSNQLMSSILSGALSADQAKSIALNIGQQVGNYGVGFAVTANINEIIGPNGENLTKEPLKIRVNLINEKIKQGGDVFNQMQGSSGFLRGAGMFGAVNPNVNIAGQTAAGAGVGAGIGASLGLVGGPLAPLTSSAGALIGTGVGAIAGAYTGYRSSKKANERAAGMSGAVVASQVGQLEQQQEMVDSLDLYYQKKLKELEVEGKIAKMKELQDDYDEDRLALVQKGADISKTIMSNYASTKGNVRSAMDTGIDKMLTQRYEGTDEIQYLDAAKMMLQESGLTAEQQYLVKVKMSTGELTPSQQVFLFSNFGDNKEVKEQYMDIITRFSARTSDETTRVMSMFTNPDGSANTKIQTEFIAKVSEAKTDEEAAKLVGFFAEVANTNGVFDMSAVLNYYMKNPTVAEDTQAILDNIEKNKGKLELDVMTNFLPANVMGAIDEDYFEKLSEPERLTYLKEIATIVNVPDPVIQASPDFLNWQEDGAKYNRVSFADKPIGEQIAAYRQFQPWKVSQDSIAQAAASAPVKTNTGGNKVQSSPLDDLVKKLRDVRKNQIKVTEGFNASRKALENLFGGKKTIDVFSGIENDLRGLGASENMIELIVGMDPKMYEAQKDKLFLFDNKKNIIGLKRDAKNIQEALNSITMGDWNTEMESQLKVIDSQSIAFDKLSKLGVPVADAYDLISDKARAQAIANGTNSKTLNKLIGDYKTLKVVQEAASSIEDTRTSTAQAKKDRIQEGRLLEIARGTRTAVGSTAVSGAIDAFAISSDDELKRLENSIVSMQAERTRLNSKKNKTPAQIARIKQLNEMLEDANDAFGARLVELKQTVGMFKDMFDQAYGSAMDAFDVEERKLQIDFEMNIDNKKAKQDIEDAQNQIAGDQYLIDDKEAALKAIEDQEKKINETYDKRLDALDEVEKANAAISQQQKNQITLADALTSGDIAAAARAAQEMRAQAAADAVVKEKEALEQARKNELENATGFDKMGKTDPKLGQLKTRKQLEKEILTLQDKIFEAEENMIEPQEEYLRGKEIALRNSIKGITVAGMTKDVWEQLQNNVELARVRAVEFIQAIVDAMRELDNGKVVIAKYGAQIDPQNRAEADAAARAAADAALAKAAADKAAADAKAAADKAALEGATAAEKAAAEAAARKAAEAAAAAKAAADAKIAADAAAKAAADKAAAEANAAAAKAAQDAAALAAAEKAAADAAANAVTGASTSGSKTGGTKVTVKPGDTLSEIASDNGISLKELLEANPKFTTNPKYDDGNKIWSGTTVIIPGGGTAGAGMSSGGGGGFGMQVAAKGGLINPMRFALGGFAKGTDTVPAMLTPGEFIMSKYAVEAHGINTMKAINNGQPTGGAVYNNTYTLTVNAKTNANPNEIAQAVMSTIKQVDDRRIRGVSLNGR
jgi:TP901 family phage tail tape measure protein